MPSLLRGPSTVPSEPNVTPMIDVLLVLLVIFMLVNLLQMRLVQDVPLQGPAGSGVEKWSSQVLLELHADGSVAVNGQSVPSSQLGAYLKDTYARRPSKLLFIRPDTSRTYQDVVDAMDLARSVGVESIGLVPVTSR